MLIVLYSDGGSLAKSRAEVAEIASECLSFLQEACPEVHQSDLPVRPYAVVILAYCHYFGFGVEADSVRAFDLLLQAISVSNPTLHHPKTNTRSQ